MKLEEHRNQHLVACTELEPSPNVTVPPLLVVSIRSVSTAGRKPRPLVPRVARTILPYILFWLADGSAVPARPPPCSGCPAAIDGWSLAGPAGPPAGPSRPVGPVASLGRRAGLARDPNAARA